MYVWVHVSFVCMAYTIAIFMIQSGVDLSSTWTLVATVEFPQATTTATTVILFYTNVGKSNVYVPTTIQMLQKEDPLTGFEPSIAVFPGLCCTDQATGDHTHPWLLLATHTKCGSVQVFPSNIYTDYASQYRQVEVQKLNGYTNSWEHVIVMCDSALTILNAWRGKRQCANYYCHNIRKAYQPLL